MRVAGACAVAPAVMALALCLPACGGSDPPDRATSTNEIHRTIVDFSRMAYNGEGVGACRLATSRSSPQGSEPLPGKKASCADFWSRLGPADPRVQAVVFDDRMASVTIRRTNAVAHMASGDNLALVWSEGRWKVDFQPED